MTDKPSDHQITIQPEDARAHWIKVAQCLRCLSCGSDQFQLRSFEGVACAYWRCRCCNHLWETKK